MWGVSRCRWVLTGAASFLALAAMVLAAVLGTATASAAPAPAAATFTVTGTGRAIPRSFLGLSIEYNELGHYEAEGPLFDRVVRLIRPQDGSPMTLRVGGKSADHVLWQTANIKPPKWVTILHQKWLDSLAALVAREGFKVMLDLNLAVHSPALETAFALAADHTLPRNSLSAVEIGNEPDLYWRQPQLEKQRVATTHVSKNWALNYGPANYRRDYMAYAQALRAKLPKVAIGAPEIISAKPAWLNAVEGLGAFDPSFLAVHRYASSTCWPSTSPWYPTIATMLSEGASAGLANTVSSAVSFAHTHGQGLRLSEVNSISCGGNVGVANSFATALWAPDVLFSMIETGVDGVSWHIRPSTPNAPFLASQSSITPMPELYGLAVFADMDGQGARLLSSRLVFDPALHLKAWAVRSNRGLRVLVINKGPRAAEVTLRLGTSGTAYVRRLLAPHISSSSGITFGGQAIGPDARWHGTVSSLAIKAQSGAYPLAVPGYSAALVSVWK